VTHGLHRYTANRAVRLSLGSQRIKQKIRIGFHGAFPVAARFTTAEALEGCLTVRWQRPEGISKRASKADMHVAVVYPPAFLVGVGIEAAGVVPSFII